MSRGYLGSWQWWTAYLVIMLPLCILFALAWDFPFEIAPLVVAAVAAGWIAGLVTEWLRQRERP